MLIMPMPALANPYPNASSRVVVDDAIRHVEVEALGQAGLDLQEDFGLELSLGPEDQVHVVAGRHDALGSG